MEFAPPCSLPMPEVNRWEDLVGEILFFKKPSQQLSVDVSFDKEMYAPGDTVQFEIEVKQDGETIEDEAYVSIFASDDSVFYQLEEKQ